MWAIFASAQPARYLTEASVEGIAVHTEEVCKSVPNMGVIIYNRASSKLNADMRDRR